MTKFYPINDTCILIALYLGQIQHNIEHIKLIGRKDPYRSFYDA